MEQKKFGMIGVAGYIAPRHLKAIHETKNTLLAAFDPRDSVGIIDSYFPDANFFTEFERFDRHLEKMRLNSQKGHIDYISICSPNYLHDSHIRFALRNGSNAICEKPIVLNPHNIDALLDIEANSGRKVYTILQLRLHPAILKLKSKIESSIRNEKYDVDLTYITSRGNWYLHSWKGDMDKSGGIATNIGVHFFDMLYFLFGKISNNVVNNHTEKFASGFLEFEKARVRWFLSIDSNHIPTSLKLAGKRTFRSLNINGEEVEFSDGFTDLHTKIYEDILLGQGFGLEENRPAIQAVSDIRNSHPIGLKGDFHPYLLKI
jgi:UDP-N-acetyl-2-amino-2-deoxyglucuronate dehydrogenase